MVFCGILSHTIYVGFIKDKSDLEEFEADTSRICVPFDGLSPNGVDLIRSNSSLFSFDLLCLLI